MIKIVSVTLVPVTGINVVLENKLFLGNFIDKAEEVLDTLPVGSAIEIVYDSINVENRRRSVKAFRCIVKQTERGIFHKDITNLPYLSNRMLAERKRQLYNIIKNRAR